MTIFRSVSPSDRTLPIIGIALGTIFSLGGIFLLLSSYHCFPFSVTLPDQWGYILGYTLTALGVLGFSYSLLTSLHSPGKDPAALDKDPAVLDRNGQLSPQERDTEEDRLKIDLEKIKTFDGKLGSTRWKQGHPNEKYQSFNDFKALSQKSKNLDKNRLQIFADEETTLDQRKMLQIVADYISNIHGIAVSIEGDFTSDATHVRTRRLFWNSHLQYSVEYNFQVLWDWEERPETSFIMGFTNKDLFFTARPEVNFTFGYGDVKIGGGFFSVFHFKDTSFETTLTRLMKLASHEFSHLRGITHCTHYACNMQGTDNVEDANKVPLTFCSEDMAKICDLNGWTLKEGYQRQRDFFEGFSRRYNYNISFSKERELLETKIQILNNA